MSKAFAPNQCRSLRIVAGLGNDGLSITVADDDHRAIPGVNGGLRVLDILGVESIAAAFRVAPISVEASAATV